MTTNRNIFPIISFLTKGLLTILFLSLPLMAEPLHLKKGFVAAHTEMLLSKTIDPLNTNLQADVTMQGDDITSLKGKFWIEMDLFISDDEGRDNHMYESMQTDIFPHATYTLIKTTKLEDKDTYQIEGILNFFGQEQAFSTQSHIILNKGILTLNATSMIRVSDYGLQMPCLIFMCVEDEVDLFIKAVLVQ